jgi:K+-dependent Na+/Ca+ exchanger-like protein
MAAGGSAPELFTSFMGVFASGSDVGFGTIIGSAVFNVLFVIGMCAVCSKELLELTWWPLFRDCTYYLISLCVLATFFGVDYGNGQGTNMIEWWESLILFGMYCGYVIVMKFNAKLEMGCKTKCCRQTGNGTPATAVVPAGGEGGQKRNGIITHSTSMDVNKASRMEDQNVRASFLRPCKFRAGVLHLMLNQTSNSTIIQRARTFVVADIVGDFKQTFAQIDINGDGAIEKDELSELLKELTGTPPDKEEVDEAFKDMGADSKGGEVTLEMFRDWYKDSETRVSKQAHDAFDQIDVDGDGAISQSELEAVLSTLAGAQHPELSDEDRAKKTTKEVATVLETFGHSTADGDDKVFTFSFDEFMKWYKDSIMFQEQMEKNAAQETANKQEASGEDGEEPISMAFPATTGARIMYCITFPIMISLVLTVPDVRNPKYSKFFPLSFLMSIVWIGFYSFLMVWWATIIGLVAGIPDTVMGLTFLAAGTSIPDLLTSVIVARQGLGDMAVSSSIGSNIFDILVGLPVPWLVYSAVYKGKAMQVYSNSLLVSVITLVGMLMAVICTIAVCKWYVCGGLWWWFVPCCFMFGFWWLIVPAFCFFVFLFFSRKMSKALGAVMFLLYGGFVASDLARANWDMACDATD